MGVISDDRLCFTMLNYMTVYDQEDNWSSTPLEYLADTPTCLHDSDDSCGCHVIW